MRPAVLLASVSALLAVAAAQVPSGPIWNPLAPGTATVHNGAELLAALEANTGNISLAGDIYLQPSDWQSYALPINITAFNQTVLIHGDSTLRVLDWGGAIGLLNVGPNSTLALDFVSSEHPGNRTRGVETLQVEVKGSPLWPTVVGADGHKAAMANMQAQIDIHDCIPAFVEIEAGRIAKQLVQIMGASGASLVQYMGGVSMHYVYIPFPAPLFSLITKQQIGTAMYTLKNMNTTCYNSAPEYGAATGGGDGLPTWAKALIGALAGCAGIALGFLAYWWCWYRRRLQRQLAAADEERASKHGSGADLASMGSGKLTSYDAQRDKLSRGGSASLSAQPSGKLQSPFLRTRFGPIDGVQLGELLGRGAYGRVYRGRWKGAIVAVKVIDHRVGPGKTCDLSREPLLSMSVSHPNVVITHKMCVVKVVPAAPLAGEGDAAQQPQHEQQAKQLSGRSGASGSSGSGGGRLVPNLDGSGFVELVSPHDVLQPGMYETWLITELCDRGSLADLVHSGRMGGADPAQRDIWALLCLLDIALGLEYLHSNTIIHGDLKPANVLLKAARNDRRGFVCKLGDFGLSWMLGVDESHVDTQSYGTASYAAPELLSHGKLTKAADIYSLGIVMWEAVAARELYPDLMAMQVILQVSQHGLRPEVPASCPPALAELMQRCWAQDAAQRPQAAQVVEELRQQVLAMRLPAPAPGAAPPRPLQPQQRAAAAVPGSTGGEGGA
ncbi:hypothetical protein ABPG75_012474 [Micractinium tetrahymenae]